MDNDAEWLYTGVRGAISAVDDVVTASTDLAKNDRLGGDATLLRTLRNAVAVLLTHVNKINTGVNETGTGAKGAWTS